MSDQRAASKPQFPPASNGHKNGTPDLTYEAVAAHYGQSGRKSIRIPCPAHGGEGNNLNVSPADDGGIVACCHSHGCTMAQICAGIRQDMGLPDRKRKAAPAAPPSRPRIPSRTPDQVWTYQGPDGLTGRMRRWDEPGGKVCAWVKGARPTQLLYYAQAENADELEHTVICEGAKAADAAAAACLDYRVIGTVSCGTTPTAETLALALSGCRSVTFWRDTDEDGLKHQAAVLAVVRYALGDQVELRAVDVDGMPDVKGADAADVSPQERADRVANAQPWAPTAVEDAAEQGAPDDTPDTVARRREGHLLSETPGKRPRWLLEPWLRRAKLHSLEGKKGVGKSQITLYLAKQIFSRHAAGKVLLFTREDDVAEDIVPRAMALGVDLGRIIVYDDQVTFADIAEIVARIEKDDALLVVFDTLQKYVANKSADMNSAFAAQGELDGVEAIVKKTGCAVLVVRHTRKGLVKDAAEAGLGSQAVGGAMRAILSAGRITKDGDEYGLALAVGNSARDGGGIVYRLESTRVQVSDGMASTSYVNVIREDPRLTADMLTGGGGSEGDSAIEEAVTFLKGRLEDGPALKRDIIAEGRREDISAASIRRAAHQLGVVKAPFETPGVARNRWPSGWSLSARVVQGCSIPFEQPKEIAQPLESQSLLGCSNENGLNNPEQPNLNNPEQPKESEEKQDVAGNKGLGCSKVDIVRAGDGDNAPPQCEGDVHLYAGAGIYEGKCLYCERMVPAILRGAGSMTAHDSIG